MPGRFCNLRPGALEHEVCGLLVVVDGVDAGARRDCTSGLTAFTRRIRSGRFGRGRFRTDVCHSLALDPAGGQSIMPTPVAGFSDAAMLACLFFIFLVPLAGAGISLINTGLGRSRNAGHMMMAAVSAFAVAAIVYFICGFAWQGFIGIPGHSLIVSGKSWNWIAAQPFFFRGLAFDGSPASLAALLQIFCVGLAALIPLGSGADRWRLRASCASAAILAGMTYPLFAHWVWGGGWLAQLGANYGLGHGFIDAGGASSIHVVGGLTALAVTWILGPRRG